jgi:DNA-directed RNA polymerase specialized sigma24 family protein
MATGGIGPAHRAPPGIDPEDAAFITQKRAEGVPDSQIAKMLGCTLKRVQSYVTGAEPTEE